MSVQIAVTSDFSIVTRTIHKIYEANSRFHVKECTAGKIQFLFFRDFCYY